MIPPDFPFPRTIFTVLKRHPDALVTVACLAAAMWALVHGAAALPVIAVLVIALGAYLIQSMARMRHEQTMADAAVNREVAKVEQIKARHRQLQQYEQPALPLENGSRAQPSGRTPRGHR